MCSFVVKHPNSKQVHLLYYRDVHTIFNLYMHLHIYPSHCWPQELVQNVVSRARSSGLFLRRCLCWLRNEDLVQIQSIHPKRGPGPGSTAWSLVLAGSVQATESGGTVASLRQPETTRQPLLSNSSTLYYCRLNGQPLEPSAREVQHIASKIIEFRSRVRLPIVRHGQSPSLPI